MAIYHNTSNGPRICHASVRECPYAAAGGEHFDNQKDAQAAYDKKMEQAFGLIPVLNKKEKLIQKTYQATDYAEREIQELANNLIKIDNAVYDFSARQKNNIRAKVNNFKENYHKAMNWLFEDVTMVSDSNVINYANEVNKFSPSVRRVTQFNNSVNSSVLVPVNKNPRLSRFKNKVGFAFYSRLERVSGNVHNKASQMLASKYSNNYPSSNLYFGPTPLLKPLRQPVLPHNNFERSVLKNYVVESNNTFKVNKWKHVSNKRSVVRI